MDGAAIGPPHGESDEYQGSGSVIRSSTSRWRSASGFSRSGPRASPGRNAARIRSDSGSAGRRSRANTAEGRPGSPTDAVPSATSVPSGSFMRTAIWVSRGWPGRSARAWTGSPSVVADRKYSDRLPVSNHDGPNASTSSGTNWSMCTLPATVPPRKPSLLATSLLWMLPGSSRYRLCGRRTGPVSASSGMSRHLFPANSRS